ncbi:MAG: hypothetical protein CL897_06600 [Dehalococcoidia bacterium]|nr:hypothetical protein [Dehalococcoidia bacterium]
MQVSPSVRAVQVPDESPMRPQSTNIYLVGRNQVLTIDSGEALDRYRWMLRGYLAATEKAEIAIAAVTHHHADHSGNLKWTREIFDAEIAIPANGRALLKGRLPAKGVRKLNDGQLIELDGNVPLRVVASPGHSVDSICYYLEDEGVLFTGDTLLGSTTTTIGDLAAYRASLQRLVDLPNLKVICPGHGPLVHDPRKRLQSYIDHRNTREAQILDALKEGSPRTSWEIMLSIYPEIDSRLRRAADGNVRTHLAQLEAEGRVLVSPGRPRRTNARSRIREEARQRERERVIKRARRLEVAARRAEVRAQENPPTEQWIEAPRYELS